jgi:multiple sugar transport system permease protein
MTMTARKRREAFDAFSMLAPTLLGLLVFFAFPLAYSLVLSVTDTRLFGDANFVGLDNYVKAIGDPTFHRALGNTLLFSAATLIVSIVPALFLAVLLNEKLPAQAFFRGIYFVPVVASVVGVSLLWRYLLNFDFGFVNYAIRELGKILGTKWEGVPWLTNSNIALISVILVFSWKTIGYNMVILLSGLQSISKPLYEAAAIDGASRWQAFRSITMPMLSPTTFFVLVTTLINCLQVFDIPYALGWTRSSTAGPADSMLTNSVHLYREGFINSQMGYASSLAWVLFAIIMIITFVQFRMSNRWVNYE